MLRLNDCHVPESLGFCTLACLSLADSELQWPFCWLGAHLSLVCSLHLYCYWGLAMVDAFWDLSNS